MKRKLVAVASIIAMWAMVVSVVDHRRASKRRDLWAEATHDNTSR